MTISADERAMIDAAISAGRVTLCPPMTFSEGAFDPVRPKEKGAIMWRNMQRGQALRAADRRADGDDAPRPTRGGVPPYVVERRKRVLALADGSRTASEIAAELGLKVEIVQADGRALRAAGHEIAWRRVSRRDEASERIDDTIRKMCADGATIPEIERATGLGNKAVWARIRNLRKKGYTLSPGKWDASRAGDNARINDAIVALADGTRTRVEVAAAAGIGTGALDARAKRLRQRGHDVRFKKEVSAVGFMRAKVANMARAESLRSRIHKLADGTRSRAEIAEIVGRSPNSVSIHLTRLREAGHDVSVRLSQIEQMRLEYEGRLSEIARLADGTRSRAELAEAMGMSTRSICRPLAVLRKRGHDVRLKGCA